LLSKGDGKDGLGGLYTLLSTANFSAAVH